MSPNKIGEIRDFEPKIPARCSSAPLALTSVPIYLSFWFGNTLGNTSVSSFSFFNLFAARALLPHTFDSTMIRDTCKINRTSGLMDGLYLLNVFVIRACLSQNIWAVQFPDMMVCSGPNVDPSTLLGTAATLIPRTTPHGCACNTSWPLQLQQWRPIFGPTLLASVQGKVPAVVTVLWSSVLELHSELKIPNRQPH
ncbi:hypothetical protein PHYBLDRAFT_150924 [Phycomyces blakesleeanus NRRL 1555(-)]|uniref:Uncharacterized protein n=1 Tax=Phycomyces blakesleeanus (strain ATCC 8743b / DSM 1359 / FGSC 10004 / NBRC 33097 / NRRL 1555) TaxID=763407 RepID=A0A163D0J4_PHYB8|nr:hypothetical protein PHYBLDRAFT_150924 [Phycomyces blakesleeanus NRRL 1555(-)]OAD67840.1 hypothetical protein PHYBLDRAFT_150924 [Phycomyces blakesleeanus NRRL 1555(-)]|eukprot:XP_018285880.1 hypothetical protein PHYBLDRAFT_150924 [Phycomyces blakesleeanus NRRL 1555(-)]